MTGAGPDSAKRINVIETRATVGAIALSLIYAAMLMIVASPVSFYTLDDPYIHLALAENLARGVFGVNLDEVSNPSSSILWPWLMATFERIGLLLWAPLLVNIASFVATVRVVLVFSLKRMAPDGVGLANALIVLGLGLLAFNLFGVIFTGMEHSLHVLLCVVAVTRVIDGRYDRMALAALVLGPLVRFEGAIVLAFGVGAALVDRKWVFAAVAAVVPALVIGAYGVWLNSIGLPVLPSSVLSKSAVSSGVVDGGGSLIDGLLANLQRNATSPPAPMLGVMTLGLVYAVVKRAGRDRILALGMIAVLLLAMMLGRMDNFARYEVYLLCTVAVALVHLLQGELRMLLSSRVRSVALGAGLALLCWTLGPVVLVTTPQAARNIDRQQHLMHQLIVECWKKPVAVNDLGWVSFRNDQHVLDLYGLGSEVARKARVAREPGWMKRLADERGVELVMIYPDWFPDIPAEWIPAGALVDMEPRITPHSNGVRIYATHAGAVEPVQTCLRQIAEPGGPEIVIARDT